MTTDSTIGWAPIPADEAEAWVLASPIVGWVARDDLDRAARLLEEIGRLEAYRECLSTELERERATARTLGVAEGAAAVEELTAAVAAERSRLRSAAADVAVQIAVGIVGDSVLRDCNALRAWAGHALGDLDTAEATEIEVAPELVELVTPLVGVPVRAGVGLGLADARVLVAAGKREFRLSEVLATLRPEVETSLEGA